MPILRQTSATGMPSSAWRRPKATCSGEYRELFMGRSSYSVRLDHPTKLAFQPLFDHSACPHVRGVYHVAVGVHGGLDACTAKPSRDNVHWRARGKEGCGMVVSQVMEPNPLSPAIRASLLNHLLTKSGSR